VLARLDAVEAKATTNAMGVSANGTAIAGLPQLQPKYEAGGRIPTPGAPWPAWIAATPHRSRQTTYSIAG